MPIKPRKNKHRWRELFKSWNENGYNSRSRLSSISWARFWAVFGLGKHSFLLLFGDRSYEMPGFHYCPSLWVSKLSVRVRILLLLEFSRNGDPRICSDGGGDSLGQPSPHRGLWGSLESLSPESRKLWVNNIVLARTEDRAVLLLMGFCTRNLAGMKFILSYLWSEAPSLFGWLFSVCKFE